MHAAPTWLALRGRRHRLDPADPWVMAVVNASPESFSDGTEIGGADERISFARSQVAAGAHALDIGGESGVTDVPAVAAELEAERVVPLVEALAGCGAVLSVDTWKVAVAKAALAAGAHLLNDVSGLRDPGLAEVCADAGAGLVLMHTRAAPKVKGFPRYDDVVDDVVAFLAEKLEHAVRLGVPEESIVLDPGPDFAKTPAQTVAVLRALDRLAGFGRPVLLAASRKDFIGAINHQPPRARLAGTLAAVAEGLDRGASILRVHDVGAVNDFLRIRRALRGDLDVPGDLHLPTHLRREPT